MKNFINRALGSVAVLALSAFAAFGQITPSTTTLSAAVSANAKSVVLASVSAVTVPGVPNGTTLGGPVSPYSYEYLYIDREMMKINSLNGNTVLVQRGVAGTKATAHNSGAVVTVTRPANFTTVDLSGACTVTSSTVLPMINPATGNSFVCMPQSSGGSIWGAYSASVDAPSVGAAIASASTIAPVSPVTHITGTTALSTITVPSGFPNGGQLTLIFDGADTWNASGNIAVASAAAQTVGESVTLTFDAATSKWYPSHL